MERVNAVSVRRYVIELALLVLCGGLALHFRLELLDSAAIGSDAINPYLKAWLVLTGKTWFPLGPFPESGYIVGFTFVPYLAWADSLRDAMRTRFCLNAFSFLPLYIGLTRLAAPPGTGAAMGLGLAAALAMALSPGLADTLLTGYQTFDVSLYATLPTVGALWVLFGDVRPAGTGSAWCSRLAPWLIIPWLPILAMLHPYAIVYALISLYPVGILWRRGAWRSVLGAAGVALLLTLPQLYRYHTQAAGRSEGVTGMLVSIARSPGGFDSLPAVLRKAALEEMLTRDLFPHGALLAAPLLTVLLLPLAMRFSSPEGRLWLTGVRRFSLWSVGGELALIGVAAIVRYLQPYHLRVLFPVMAVQLALLLAVLSGAARQGIGRTASARSPTSPDATGTDTSLREVTRPDPGPAGVAAPGVASRVSAILLFAGCAAIGGSMWVNRFPPPPVSPATLAGLEAVSSRIRVDADARPLLVEYVHLSNELAGYAGAVVLDLLLSGMPESRFVRQSSEILQARFELALSGPPAVVAATAAQAEGLEAASRIYRSGNGDLELIRIDGLDGVRRWSSQVCGVLPTGTPVRLGGANDYLGLFNREHDTTLERGWFADCLWKRGE